MALTVLTSIYSHWLLKVIYGDRFFHFTHYACHHLEKQLNDVMYNIGYGIGRLIYN